MKEDKLRRCKMMGFSSNSVSFNTASNVTVTLYQLKRERTVKLNDPRIREKNSINQRIRAPTVVVICLDAY